MLTDRERGLMGKRVILTQCVVYGGKLGTVTSGTQGEIVDFGRSSGEPAIKFDNSGQVGIVPWGCFEVLHPWINADA